MEGWLSKDSAVQMRRARIGSIRGMMVHAEGMVGQRLGTLGLSKIQPKPWCWCMQVPSYEMQAAWPQPPCSLVPHRGLPLIHYPSPSCHLLGFAEEERRSGDLKVGLRACSGWALMQDAGLPTEVEK